MNPVVNRAEALAAAVDAAEPARAFERAVVQFTRFLATMPDYGPTEISKADIDRVCGLAENIIQSIERRLDTRHDRPAVQRDLADAIYRIRSKLEEIDLWRRHYISPPS